MAEKAKSPAASHWPVRSRRQNKALLLTHPTSYSSSPSSFSSHHPGILGSDSGELWWCSQRNKKHPQVKQIPLGNFFLFRKHFKPEGNSQAVIWDIYSCLVLLPNEEPQGWAHSRVSNYYGPQINFCLEVYMRNLELDFIKALIVFLLPKVMNPSSRYTLHCISHTVPINLGETLSSWGSPVLIMSLTCQEVTFLTMCEIRTLQSESRPVCWRDFVGIDSTYIS